MRRGRDRLGRPVPLESPDALPDVPQEALPRGQALALAQSLLDEGRAFAAHEVLEASWKAAAGQDRRFWQGLAQLCVGVTHLQRGNAVGAARLLRRGAGQLDGTGAPDVGVQRVCGWALRLAAAVESGQVQPGGVDAAGRGPDGPLRLLG